MRSSPDPLVMLVLSHSTFKLWAVGEFENASDLPERLREEKCWRH
jgi:hypothetical protein